MKGLEEDCHSPNEVASCNEKLRIQKMDVVLSEIAMVLPYCVSYFFGQDSDIMGEALTALTDWESVVDRAPDELLSSESLPDVSKVSLADSTIQTPKRRGRGTFSYRKNGLYSDHQSDGLVMDNSEKEAASHSSEGLVQERDLKYGTRHALVLADFPPSMTTADLEKLFENIKDHEVDIRWVNDTTALGVFRTPSIALEACNSIECPFTVRVLDENDVLLSSIKQRDLEPPRRRPKTSARTAQRLIAHGMGLKLPSTSFGLKEQKKQEAARKQRIVSRQSMRDDAWGDDDVK